MNWTFCEWCNVKDNLSHCLVIRLWVRDQLFYMINIYFRVDFSYLTCCLLIYLKLFGSNAYFSQHAAVAKCEWAMKARPIDVISWCRTDGFLLRGRLGEDEFDEFVVISADLFTSWWKTYSRVDYQRVCFVSGEYLILSELTLSKKISMAHSNIPPIGLYTWCWQCRPSRWNWEDSRNRSDAKNVLYRSRHRNGTITAVHAKANDSETLERYGRFVSEFPRKCATR